MSKNGWRCVDRLSRHHCFLWIWHFVRLQSLLGSSQQCGRVGVSLSCLPDLTNGDVGDAAYGATPMFSCFCFAAISIVQDAMASSLSFFCLLFRLSLSHCECLV